MRYLALASDYDGTLAHDGRVTPQTLASLKTLRESGRRLLMVTGRELEELQSVFPEHDIFDRIVAENGALIYTPEGRSIRTLAEAPPPEFAEELRRRGAERVAVGRVIVATWEPYEKIVLDTIRDMGLELQVIFNKGAVMILPTGVTKATGLAAALEELGLSLHNAVGIGDAENDHAFLSACECGVATANAIPTLKERADFVTKADHGAGVEELIARLEANDLRDLDARLSRHHLVLGRHAERDVHISPYGSSLLVAGASGSGKTEFAVGMIERIGDATRQFCVIDPEGDYSTLENAVAVGTHQQAPDIDEVLRLLANPWENVVVNLVGIRLSDRPAFFISLLTRIQELRVRTGRPHWLIIDEAHHVLPAKQSDEPQLVPQGLNNALFITVDPRTVQPQALNALSGLIVVGPEPADTLKDFCEARQQRVPKAPRYKKGAVCAWLDEFESAPISLDMIPSRTQRRRHHRKYAEGDLGPDRSFYFRGPEDRLNLRAQNLMIFLQMADGVDDETWEHHLHAGEYSHWFRECVKDPKLADEAAEVEKQTNLTPAESRAKIRELIERDYTAPAHGDVAPAQPSASSESSPGG
jgi:HAD superfamily hydrolase (TIGR01484 family)